MGTEDYVRKIKKEARSPAFYRDVAAEVIGTFILVAVQIALVLDPSTTPNPNNTGNILRIAVGMGFVVVILADSLGSFGGGHFNPAVTVAQVACLKITVYRAVFYIVGQVLGGILAGLFVYGVTSNIDSAHGGFAVTLLSPGVTPAQGLFVELFATTLLVFAVLGGTDGNRRNVVMPALPIGIAVACALLTAIPYTGASINPARSLGPALIANQLIPNKAGHGDPFANHWVYWVGPFLGALVATLIYWGFSKADKPTVEMDINGTAYEMDKSQL